MTSPIHLQCPQCKAPVVWNDEYPYRPFCSKRCQLIDFGDWAQENYRIAAEPAPDSRDETEEY